MKKTVLQRLNRLNTIIACQESINLKSNLPLQLCLIDIPIVLNNTKLRAISAYSKAQQLYTNNQILK